MRQPICMLHTFEEKFIETLMDSALLLQLQLVIIFAHGSSATGAWVTPYIMDPTNAANLFAGYDKVWKTTIEEIHGQAHLKY